MEALVLKRPSYRKVLDIVKQNYNEGYNNAMNILETGEL